MTVYPADMLWKLNYEVTIYEGRDRYIPPFVLGFIYTSKYKRVHCGNGKSVGF